MFEMPDFIVICLTSGLGLMYVIQAQLILGFWGNRRATAMEQWRNSQLITGYMGCAHHHIQEGIRDTCVGRKDVSHSGAGKTSYFPK